MADVKIDGGLPYATTVGSYDVVPVVQNGVTYAARAYMLSATGGGASAVSATPTGAYTLTKTDAGATVEVNTGSAVAVTVPTATTAGWPSGSVVQVFQVGTGQVTVTAAAGVTLQSAGGLTKVRAQYGNVRLRYRGSDTWAMTGDLA